MSAWKPPEEFDGYRLVRRIGYGGMGEVHLGHDTVLDRPVAVKFILGARATKEARKRFFVEARAIARLQHPNVVSIYRVGEVDGHPYLISEFVKGVGLDTLPRPVPWRKAFEIGLDIARGLAAAHRRGVVHRDIKPANVLVSDDGEIKLVDFGVAKLMETPDVALMRRVSQGEIDAAEELPPPSVSPDAPTSPITVSESKLAVDAGSADLLVTRPGVALGTPAYIPPEVWQGEPATFRSDVYALGVLLYGLCAGRPPHEAPDVEMLCVRVITEDARPLADLVPGIDPAFAAVIDRCLARDTTRRYASANDVRAALAQLTPEARANVVPDGNPYRGLHAFDVEHRALFFGRDSEIRTILERLSTEPFILVAGDSGVGKSSLCRAGVLPRAPEWLDAKRTWSTVSLVPGKRPANALAAAFAPHFELPEPDVARLIDEEPAAFARALRQKLGDRAGLVLFIDQLEELVTIADARQATAVAEVVAWLAGPSSSVRVLATVRGDFLSRLATLPPIVEELSRALYFLRPLSAERIREAIVGPAAAKGVTFENDELVDTLVASTARAGGGLPLLQFALSELWNVRDRVRQVITAQALEAVGGVAGALSRHADDLLARMLPAEREAARVILLRLVTPDNTRARRTEDELVTEGSRARAALDALVQGRLVVASESAEGTGFEIAHEALLSGWGTLARWLSQDADLRVVRERLLRAAADWERLGRRRDLLWGHRQLVEADGLRAAGLTEREARFVEASRAAARRSRVLRMAAIASVPAVVLLAYGGAKLKAARDNDRRVDSALAHIDAALASAREQHAALHAIRKLAFDQFDEPNVVEAEKTWARVRSSQADLSRAFSRIAQEVEAALALAPERKDVRARLADVLYERALFAEERHAASERDELLDRLTLYDATEERLARWNAPASVSLVVTPDAATVRLARYESSESGLRIEVPVATVLNETPRPLARGSYVVTVEASGFAKVRYPFRVERGEEARFAIDLPRADDVPNGFVFVPPGRFLFGSQEEDSLRRSYYHTVPLHTATTGAYLIAVHETTFGDWIEYLRALPPEERASRFPEVKGGFQGALAWKAVEGGRFEVTFQPASHKFTLREGELVTYPGRTGRAAQDWRRFPVSGVGAGDADAYAKWLDATGKVRGARLCTELEWQRAARGADDRHFPHGDALAPDHANFDDTYDKAPLAMGPDEVGSHPLSQSPFGIDDAAGNVWEWTVSSLGKGEHAAVGGSYYFSANSSRVSNREVTEPSFRDVSVGFRICADAPRAETARHAPSAR